MRNRIGGISCWEESLGYFMLGSGHVVNAACINANLPIPGESARFYGVRRVSDDLARFLEASQGVCIEKYTVP